MKAAFRFIVRYWKICASVLAAIAGGVLQVLHWHTASHWVLGGAAVLLLIPLLVSMYDDITHGRYGIDILAATAIVSAVLLHEYWTAIVIVIMINGGGALEDFAERRAHTELTSLLKHAPQQAHVLRGRKLLDVAAADVQQGDKIVIKPGEIVPVDAIITEGGGDFDEASLTGESLPKNRTAGEQILSGSVNVDGTTTARALHSAADSQYQQIIKLVKGADARHAPFVRLADRYSIPFTIAAFLIAGAAWYVSGRHAIRFLEVIVVATPCPLLIAAPIALVSGMARASKRGIIIKTGSAMERLAEAETFAFDKTGTLTSGVLKVVKVSPVKPFSANEVLGLAASLGENSNHIVSQAVVTAAREKGFNYARAKHIRELSGRGVEAQLQGKQVAVGNPRLMSELSVAVPASIKQADETMVFVAQNNTLVGTISFSDALRPETRGTLARLKTYGVKHLLMITGDNKAAAEAIAAQAGITEVKAEALPADKLFAIDNIQHRPVAFVGDGVNDAPALTASDIGIALGARGSTAASESAEVVIIPDDISLVATALGIARRTFAIARQSILIGIFLSLVLMAVFATGKFQPIWGALLQELVDVFVIFNALRAHLDHRAKTAASRSTSAKG